MTETTPEPRRNDGWLEPGENNAQLIYILYLAGLAVGISGLVGLVMAYINRGKAAPFVESHYTWLIRTFWIGLLYFAISAVLVFVAVGVILIFATAVWFIARCIVGLQALGRRQAIANPNSWLLG